MKPTAVILDLLRTYRRRGTTVKAIMETGAMFGFSENLMRVSLSRLAARGLIENVKRGHYRLANRADPISDFVEEWRLGENRLRAWDGSSWLLVQAGADAGGKQDWALASLGFRRVETGTWLRPDCLAQPTSALVQRLVGLGMSEGSLLASGAHLDTRWTSAWREQFDIEAMTRTYHECRGLLTNSIARLGSLAHEDALRESFHLGGRAVHILAKDPLIPAPLIDPEPRRALWQTMLSYDRLGRDAWGRRNQDRPEMMPTPQLQVSI